jgi:preprotein translocase subunit SecB
MNNSNPKSGFTLENIILIESSFNRISDVIFDDKVQNSIDINVGVASSEPKIAVTVDVAVAQNRDKVEQFRITAKMVGVFKKEGESDIKSDEDFGRINGAAIVFPFVREHIANMALKGGLGTVLIPPVNFTKYTGKE